MKMEGDDYYGKRFVTQHDLLRELAIYNAKIDPVDQRKRIMLETCGNNIPKWWKEQKYQPTKARLLAITTDGKFSMKWPQIQLPEAEVLVLNFDAYRYAIPEFVEKMDKLKVVVIFSSSSFYMLKNLELLLLLPNLKRISLHDIPINSIRNNPIQLKSLKKISLSSCYPMASLSKGVGKMSDAFPNIEELNIDHCDEPEEFLVDFFNVIHLKKISIFDCPELRRLPEEIGNLVNLEVLRLRECSNLLGFTGSVRNLKKLDFLDMSGCLDILLPEDIGELSSLRMLDMRGCYEVRKLPSSVADLDQLEEVRCNYFSVGLWEAFLPTLTSLRIVEIPQTRSG